MNERIKELGQEARLKVNALYESMEVEPDSNFIDWFDEHFEEKFAELLVRECGSAVSEGFNLWPNAVERVIKEHFGVE